MTARPKYLIELEPIRGDARAVRDLARLLKCLLRGYGFRCVSVAEIPKTEQEGKP